MKKTVRIEDYSDGFGIIILDGQGCLDHAFNFNQEDTREKLVEVFKALDTEATYEEVY